MILQNLNEKERNVAWLARKLSCNDANLGRQLANSKHIHCELLLRISNVLKKDFFVHYSEIVDLQ